MTTHDITTKIDEFVLGRLSLEEVEAWLLTHLQAILDTRDETVVTLANRVDADLMEFREGMADVADLVDRFEKYRRGADTVVVVGDRQQIIGEVTGTGVQVPTRVLRPSSVHTVTLRPAFVS